MEATAAGACFGVWRLCFGALLSERSENERCLVRASAYAPLPLAQFTVNKWFT